MIRLLSSTLPLGGLGPLIATGQAQQQQRE
jgi:hypothetical protein